MDNIKEAFQKVKEDMFYLKQELYFLTNKLNEIRATFPFSAAK